MGFVSQLRQNMGSAEDLKAADVLEPYEKFDLNDAMNDLFVIDDLRESGNEAGAKCVYQSFADRGVKLNAQNGIIGSYLSYLREKSDLEHTVSSGHQPVKLTDAEAFASAVVIARASEKLGAEVMPYRTLSKFLDISHARKTQLTDREFATLANVGGFRDSPIFDSLSRQMIAKYPIPKVKRVTDIYQTPDLSDFYDACAKDKYFANNVEIANIYAIKPNAQSQQAPKQGKQSMLLNTGTSNESLIRILNGGFKRPSQIMSEFQTEHPDATVQISGQMFGDAVYFARPDQISKNTAYVDHENPGHKFIVMADVYYDQLETLDGAYGEDRHYDGHNLVCAQNVGRYDRDEYMVAPEQIAIKYVLEVAPGELTKPLPKKDSAVSLDLSDLSQQTASPAASHV